MPKRIVAAPGRAPAEGELEVVTGNDALTNTVEKVATLVNNGSAPRDVAVLTRVNASLAPVQVALVHRDVPVRPAVDQSYLARGGVQAALAWLRLAVSPSERLAQADVVQAARRPSRAISPRVVEWMGEQSSLAGLDRLAGRLKGRDSEKVSGFVLDLNTVRRYAGSEKVGSAKAGSNKPGSNNAGRILRAVRDDIGLGRAMELLEGSRRYLDRSAQTDDLDALVALAALHPDPVGFDDWLLRSLRQPGSVDGVVLSTVHRVKGREWPHIVLHEVSAGLFPHRLALDVEEERRVFHVGPHPCYVRPSTSWRATSPRRSWPSCARNGATPGGRRMCEALKRAHLRRAEDRPPSATSARSGRGLRPRRKLWRPRLRREYGPRCERGGQNEPRLSANRRLFSCTTAPSRRWRRAPPPSMAALARVNGIGPAKLESYGDDLLAVISAAVDGG